MKKYISILLVILWMIFIFVMSSFDSNESSNQSGFIVNIISNIINYNDLDTLSFIVRKCAHFIEYLILGLLVYNMIKNYNKKIYFAIPICILYAISDEIHQLFIEGRAFKLFDIIIDSIGSISGIIIYKYILKKFTNINNKKKINIK